LFNTENYFSFKLLRKNEITSILLIILIVPLYFNNNVIFFRINQHATLTFLSSLLFLTLLFKLINSEELYLNNKSLDISIIIFFIYLTSSVFFISGHQSISLQKYFLYLSYILIFFYINILVKNMKMIIFLLKTFFITTTIISIYAILQFYGVDPFLYNFGTITSTIGQKNLISNYISMFLPILLLFFIFSEKHKLIYYIVLIINYTALMICQSRGIWISLSLATIIIGCLLSFKKQLLMSFLKNKKYLILTFITFIIITAIYSTDNYINTQSISVPSRAISIFDQKDPSINTRLLIWRTTFEMIKEKPFFGHAIGTFFLKYLPLQAKILNKNPHLLEYITNPMDAHNEYLQLIAELGIFGFLIIFFIFIQIFKIIFLSLHKNYLDKESIIFIVGLSTGLIIFLIHSLFTFPVQNPATGSAFFILLAITLNLARPKHNVKNININFSFIKNDSFKKIILLILIIIIIIFNYSMVIKPYISEIYYYRGMSQFAKQSYLESIPLLELSTFYNDSNGRIHHALGAAYYNTGNYEQAILHMKKAEINFMDKKLYRNLGLYYYKTNNYLLAEKYFEKAIYINPKYSDAYFNLGKLYYSNEKYNEAIQAWQKILQYDSNLFEIYIVYYYIGKVYQKKEMPDKALEYFSEALKLAPEGSPIIKEIEREIYNIYKGKLDN